MNEKSEQEHLDQEESSEDSTKASEDNSEQENNTIEEKTEQEESSTKKVFDQFNNALINNMERLLETNMGINELPINICTVSCIILIATRETEIESFPYLPPERYNEKMIFEELAEINIESGEDLSIAIESMTDKEYIEISDDGRFFAKPPTISMSKLIDRIFPQMPGLNLFAYLGQMMDEVLSERKKMEYALDQFEQMMKIHGVPISSPPPEKKAGATLFPHLRESSDKKRSKVISSVPQTKPSDIYSQLQTKTIITPSKPRDPAPKEDMPGHDPSAEDRKDTLVSEDLTAPEKSSAVDEKEITDGEGYQEKTEIPKDRSLDESESKSEVSEEKEALDVDSKDTDIQPEDDDIEKMVAAFEEQLGITCPLCQTPGIKSQVTAKGKSYYNCANDGCNFISWGKPYFISCPKCSNPFLIEAIENEGRKMLKCPKATCPHWQKFPWEEDSGPAGEDQGPALKDDKKPKKLRRVKKRKRRVVRRKR